MVTKNQDLIIFETDKDHIQVNVRLDGETVWLNLNQLSQLFERDKSVISRHLKKIFQEEELDRSAVVANFATTAADGKIYNIEHYNLDAIISVGYRVNSKRGTQFRQWANRVLKEHWIRESSQKVYEKLNKDNNLPLLPQPTEDSTTQAIIEGYAKTWSLLLAYDEKRLDIPESLNEATSGLEYDTAITDIEKLKKALMEKGEVIADNFGRQHPDEPLRGILGNINATWEGSFLYPSWEEKAAHLLYFLIKDHPFDDGNKRIGSFLFVRYLELQRVSSSVLENVNDIALSSLALLIANSDPRDKELLIKLIVNLIKENRIQKINEFEKKETYILLYERACRIEALIKEIKAIHQLGVDFADMISHRGGDWMSLIRSHTELVYILYRSMFQKARWEELSYSYISINAYGYNEEQKKLHFDILKYVESVLVHQNTSEPLKWRGVYKIMQREDGLEYVATWNSIDHAYNLEPLIDLMKISVLNAYKNKFGKDLPILLPYERLSKRC